MKAKHTPGPWEIEYNGPYEEYWVTTPHYDAGPARIISNIADARLIAAAPDLLEALIEYKRLYDEVQPAGGWQGVYEIGNNAIAKATHHHR